MVLKSATFVEPKKASIIKPLVKSLATSTIKYSALGNFRSKGMSPWLVNVKLKKLLTNT